MIGPKNNYQMILQCSLAFLSFLTTSSTKIENLNKYRLSKNLMHIKNIFNIWWFNYVHIKV
jgi:hypothetical protein